MNEHREDDDLESLPPSLQRLKGSAPFVVPEGFFERFPHAVGAQIAERSGRTSERNWWRVLGPAASLATLLAVFLWWSVNAPTTSADQDTGDAHWTLAELDAYDPLDEHILLEEMGGLPEWDRVDVDLTSDELLAYIEYSDLELNEVITYLE